METHVLVSFLIKLQADSLQVYQNRDYHMCFPVKFAKLLNAPFLKNISGQLLVIRSKFSMHWKEPSGN